MDSAKYTLFFSLRLSDSATALFFASCDRKLLVDKLLQGCVTDGAVGIDQPAIHKEGRGPGEAKCLRLLELALYNARLGAAVQTLFEAIGIHVHGMRRIFQLGRLIFPTRKQKVMQLPVLALVLGAMSSLRGNFRM